MPTDDISTNTAAHPDMIVRDPVGGTTARDPAVAWTGSFQERESPFCSLGCRRRSLAQPERYVQ